MMNKALGFAQTHLENFNPIGLWILALCGADFGVAVFRATISGCSEPNPVQRDWDGGNLLPCLLSATG